MSTVKSIVEEVFSIPTTKKLWTSIYWPALPFTPQHFPMGSILPAVLYMFRWGHRRGKGTFITTFGKTVGEKVVPPSIEDVTNELLKKSDWFSGFETEAERAILGDMLLSFCLENKNHKEGRTEQIQRAYPTHYLASWIDLPEKVAHLRFIPEMLTAMLANQEEGEFIARNNKKSRFVVGAGFGENILLDLFGPNMQIEGSPQNLKSDRFIEMNNDGKNDIVGLDQLLTIRIGQMCGEAPLKARGAGENENIRNQHPMAKMAVEYFREDLSVFVQAYGKTTPRQAFLQMFESCLSLGLTNIYFSTVTMLLEWERTGNLPEKKEQKARPLFVDCSSGNDRRLRGVAEESMSEFLRRFERLPIILMSLRILDDKVRYDSTMRRTLPPDYPDATEFINLLGSILKGNHPRADKFLEDIDEICLKLADALQENDNAAISVQELLRQDNNPVTRLAEALCILMGNELQITQFLKAIHSCLMIDQPNGLARKRKIYSKNTAGKMGSADARSIILSNTMLDFMVHRHLRKAAKGKGASSLTLIGFIRLLKERYGLYIDEAPNGMSIPAELLLHNRRILEKRLRDLGVLIGVNDAESMKRLQQRFIARGDEDAE